LGQKIRLFKDLKPSQGKAIAFFPTLIQILRRRENLARGSRGDGKPLAYIAENELIRAWIIVDSVSFPRRRELHGNDCS
jgi:hypothetical protein